jgi:hypothetical protein
MGGKGEGMNHKYLTSDENKFLGYYRQLNNENRAVVMKFSKALLFPNRIDNDVIRCNSFNGQSEAKIIPFPVIRTVETETMPMGDFQTQLDDFLQEMGYIE